MGCHPLSLDGLRLDTEGASNLLFGRDMKWQDPSMMEAFRHLGIHLKRCGCGLGMDVSPSCVWPARKMAGWQALMMQPDVVPDWNYC